MTGVAQAPIRTSVAAACLMILFNASRATSNRFRRWSMVNDFRGKLGDTSNRQRMRASLRKSFAVSGRCARTSLFQRIVGRVGDPDHFLKRAGGFARGPGELSGVLSRNQVPPLARSASKVRVRSAPSPSCKSLARPSFGGQD